MKKIVGVSLVVIFFLVLFMNSYFVITSGVGVNPEGDSFQEKYYLAGPDPYYNMRSITITLETGHYPWGENDKLLNYPIGNPGARPPLMNMLAVAMAKVMEPFIGLNDAIGIAMQFLPALFGALLVFPVYGLGKQLFNEKAGVIGALMIPLIPIHLASGHGSAYTLFDHDSINLFLFATIFLFYMKGLTEKKHKSYLYSMLSGVALGALMMTWFDAHFAVMVVTISFVIQVVVNILRTRFDFRIISSTLIVLSTGYLIFLPLALTSTATGMLELFMIIFVGFFSFIYFFITKKTRFPWIVTLPSIFLLGGGVYGFLWLIKDITTGPLSGLHVLASILFKEGIYGNKVSNTIAEAKTVGFSPLVMSFGPVIYWLAWFGLLYIVYRWFKKKRGDDLFFIIWWSIEIWLLFIAGRFINDFVPLIAVLNGWFIFWIVKKINFKQMVRGIRAIGGFRGVRKGIKSKHLAGITFLVFLVMLPQSFLALNAAVPMQEKPKWGMDAAYASVGLYKEKYWIDALDWLNDQDLDIDKPFNRPAFISWWDYGFYEVAVGGHPTVADNYQDGIPCAANFQTAQSEKEAVAVLIIRLLHGYKINHRKTWISDVRDMIKEHLPERNETVKVNENETVNVTYKPWVDLINIIDNPEEYAQSFDTLVAPEYGNTVERVNAENAMYHDGCRIIVENLTDAELTSFYRDVRKTTGYSILYYGVEGYDMDIFNVFSYLADKGTFAFVTSEDDFYAQRFIANDGTEYTYEQIQNLSKNEYERLQPFKPRVTQKYGYYNSFVFKCYRGLKGKFLPCIGIKHFKPVYVSPYGYPGVDIPAVVINKYYEGANVSGQVWVGDREQPYPCIVQITDDYGIGHDAEYTDSMGAFNLIALPGNATIRVIDRAGEYEIARFRFNSTDDPNWMPITEEEATWEVDNHRDVELFIEKGNISGFLVNETGDVIEDNLTLEFNNVNISVVNGFYEVKDLVPAKYTYKVFNETGDEIVNSSKFVMPGENNFNITITLSNSSET